MRFPNPYATWGRIPDRRGFGSGEHHPEMLLRHRHGGTRGGFGGRGEGKTRFFERGAFKFALLELLASEPMHGYQLIKAMEEQTGGLYTPSAGSVYPNLQLLEDMNLISCSETDGKKLYRITEEGRRHLQTREEADKERADQRRERHGRHKQPQGRHGKHDLRGLMKELSDVVYLMAKVSEAAQGDPSSEHAAQFQGLVAKFREDLHGLLASVSQSGGTDESAAPPSGDA